MVFGELLGGMVRRGGEHFQESAERQRKLEDWQRQNELSLKVDFLRQNWGDMTPDQQRVQLGGIAPLIGRKPKDLEALVTQAQAIHSIIPPQYAPPELGQPRTEQAVAGETQPALPGTVSPAFRTRTGQQIEATAAPAMPEISIGQIPQIPQPSETGTPSIFARTTGHEAVSEPRQMTPNQILEQRKIEHAASLRQQRVQEIRMSDMPPRYKEMAEAAAQGLNIVPYESTLARAETSENIANKRAAAQGKRQFYRVPGSTPGSSNVVNYIERGGKLYDDAGNIVSLPPNTVTLREGYTVTTDDAGNVNIINPQAAVGPSNYRATIAGAGRKTQPRAINNAATTVDLSPEALDAEAEYYNKTHDFSKWGMGAQAGVRQKIANRARELAAIEAPGAKAGYAAKAANWVAGNRNQKMIRSLDAVDKGLDTVIAASKKFSRSEIGLLNDIILKGEVQLNDPKAIRFQTAVQGVIDDLASALSGGGATTDAARKQAKLIFNSAYSEGGLDSAIKSVREIMAARRAAFAAGTVYEKPAETPNGGGGLSPEKEARYQELLRKRGGR